MAWQAVKEIPEWKCWNRLPAMPLSQGKGVSESLPCLKLPRETLMSPEEACHAGLAGVQAVGWGWGLR